MICEVCALGGEQNSQHHYKRAEKWHAKCEGCECQHKVGASWVLHVGEREPQMQTQSP